MRYKYIFSIVFNLWLSVVLFGKDKAVIKLHLHNLPKDSSFLYISMGEVIYYTDSVGLPESVITLKVNDPFPVSIIADNVLTSNKLFWVHEGVYDVFYDMKTYEISFTNSPLNNEFVRTRFIRDSINYLEKENQSRLWQAMDDVYRKKDTAAKARLDVSYKFYSDNERQMDVLDSLATEILYQYHIEHPNSYLALDFVNHNFNCGTIKAERLRELFAKLDKKLKKYPLYGACYKNLNDLSIIPLKERVSVPLVNPK